MTALFQPPVAHPIHTPSLVRDQIEARQATINALDSFVRPLLAERLRPPFSLGAPAVDLSAYDAVYARSSAGGHWTVSTRWMGFFSHVIAGYTVTLHFDADDRPSHFSIDGASEVVTDDATPASLVEGLDRAGRAGPCVTWAPSIPPGISL